MTQTSTKKETKIVVNKRFLEEPKKEVAFLHKGVEYYHFADNGTAIYYQRFRALQDTIRRHEEWRITADVLQEYLDLVTKFAREGNTREIELLTQKLNWRRTQSNDLMLLYDLVSIWYFDATEDPAVFDVAYAKKKIESWVGSDELLAFFLKTPLNKYIDFSDLLSDGSRQYLKELHLTLYAQSAMNLLTLSESEKESSTGKNITWLMEMYSNLTKLLDTGLYSTTTS